VKTPLTSLLTLVLDVGSLSLALPPSTKIYQSLAPCDMRKGFDGLAAQVCNILQLDPIFGAVFLFRGSGVIG